MPATRAHATSIITKTIGIRLYEYWRGWWYQQLARRGHNPKKICRHLSADFLGDVITEDVQFFDYNKITKEKQGGQQNVCYQYQQKQLPE